MTADPLESAMAIADTALDYLKSAPAGSEPVIDYATPDALARVFEHVIAFALPDDVVAKEAADLAAAAQLVVNYSVHTSHPRFFNQNFAGPDPVAVAGDWLGAALNTTAATFEVAPVFTMIEAAVLDKLARVAGYPTREAGPPPGLFAPGGSTATLYALHLARHRAMPESVRSGTSDRRFSILVSDTGHYAAEKSAALLGLGSDAVIKVATDASGQMAVDDLRTRIAESRAEGTEPLAVIATSGTTVHAAFDPLDDIADVCEDEQLWLHVDGCYGASALFSEHQRHRLSGVERSDSIVWNLHKMMGMTQQCTALLVREPEQLRQCFAVGADYLFQPDKLHGEYDSGDNHFQCARRVDALKLWLAWHAHGDRGFASRIDHAVDMADHLRSRIASSDGEFSITAPGDFTNVVFVWVPPTMRPFRPDGLSEHDRALIDRLAPRIKARMQNAGTAMIGFQPTDGINAFRWLFINPEVTAADIDDVLELLAEYGREEHRSMTAGG